MYRRILLAYDGSPQSMVALRQAADLALVFNAQLYILGVVTTTLGLALARGNGTIIDPVELERKRIEDNVESAVRKVRNNGVHVQEIFRDGDPATEIINCANHVRADLIVLGCSSNDSIMSWIRRSIRSKLLNILPCNILISSG